MGVCVTAALISSTRKGKKEMKKEEHPAVRIMEMLGVYKYRL